MKGLRVFLIKYAVELSSLKDDVYITSRYIAREYIEEEAKKLQQVVKMSGRNR